MNFGDSRLSERFWKKVHPEPMSGCWLWTAALDTNCYGCFGSAKCRSPHRIAYIVLVGDPGPGLVLDHLCRTPSCCNPAHLEPVSQHENVIRGVGPCALNAKKTHCLRGHALDGDNLVVHKDGRRECRECRSAGKRARYAAKRQSTHQERVTTEVERA